MFLSAEEYAKMLDKIVSLTAINRDYKKDNLILNKEILRQKQIAQSAHDKNQNTCESLSWKKQRQAFQKVNQITKTGIYDVTKQLVKLIQKTLQSNLTKLFEKQKTELNNEIKKIKIIDQPVAKKPKGKKANKIVQKNSQQMEKKIQNLVNFLDKIKSQSLSPVQIIRIADQYNLIDQNTNNEIKSQYGEQFFNNTRLKDIKQRQNRRIVPNSRPQKLKTIKVDQNDEEEVRLESKLKIKEKKKKLKQTTIENEQNLSLQKKQKKKQAIVQDKQLKTKLSEQRLVHKEEKLNIKKKKQKQINPEKQNNQNVKEQSILSAKKKKNKKSDLSKAEQFRKAIMQDLNILDSNKNGNKSEGEKLKQQKNKESAKQLEVLKKKSKNKKNSEVKLPTFQDIQSPKTKQKNIGEKK